MYVRLNVKSSYFIGTEKRFRLTKLFLIKILNNNKIKKLNYSLFPISKMTFEEKLFFILFFLVFKVVLMAVVRKES